MNYLFSHQDSVNLYLKTLDVDEVLNKTFEGALKEGNNIKDTILFVLNYANTKNIPVFCIDSSKIQTEDYNKISPHGRWFLKGESRDEDMFNNFVKHFDQDDNAIVFCGANHLSEGLHFRTGKETFGTKLKTKFSDDIEVLILN